jgi:hypothetical protein
MKVSLNKLITIFLWFPLRNSNRYLLVACINLRIKLLDCGMVVTNAQIFSQSNTMGVEKHPHQDLNKVLDEIEMR